MRSAHSSGSRLPIALGLLLLLLAAALPVRAQSGRSASFTVFLRGIPIGNEQVAVDQTPEGFLISSSGRIGPPTDLVLRSFSARYDSAWKPVALSYDATIRDQSATMETTVSGTTARNIVTPLNQPPVERTDTIVDTSVFLPNPFVGAYEALSARLRTADQGSTLAVYMPALGSFPADVGVSTVERIQTLDRTIVAKRTRVVFRLPAVPPLDLEIWGDETGRLLRVSIPSQLFEAARQDVASVASRLVTMDRPNDENVLLPANGFSLAGTLSKPRDAKGPLPAVVLLSGAGDTDRDETVAGVSIFGQLANALADAGLAVLRYDKRGVGQSGGRPESATLTDYANDARDAINALANRKDVDKKRIAVLGYGEGGWIAMMAAAKNNKVAALVLLATVAAPGSELNLYQVAHGLERSNWPDAQKQQTIDLQKKIQQAVITGKGWETLGADPTVRRQADTPYFQSFLMFDPAKVMKDIKQPVLIVEGGIDKQLPPANADRLVALAKTRKTGTVDAQTVPGLNHLLVPAATGEVEEYVRLADHALSAAVLTAVTAWIPTALPAQR